MASITIQDKLPCSASIVGKEVCEFNKNFGGVLSSKYKFLLLVVCLCCISPLAKNANKVVGVCVNLCS